MTIRRQFILGTFAVALVAAAVGVWLFQRQPSDRENNSNALVVGEDVTSATVSTAPIVTGDIPVNQSISYRGVQFDIETALKAAAFRRSQAPNGSQHVVLFLKPFSQAPAEDPLQWAAHDIRLSSSSDPAHIPTEVSIPTSINVSGGYLWFTVPTEARDFALVFGSGPTAQRLNLAIE